MTPQDAPSLFEDAAPRPLADRLRPRTLDEVVGQDHLLRPDGPLGRMVASGALASTVLWGPPGLRQDHHRAPARRSHGHAVRTAERGLLRRRRAAQGVRRCARAPRRRHRHPALRRRDPPLQTGRSRTRSCPWWRTGPSCWWAATTENPSFELNGALLSRCAVLVLNRLDDNALETLLTRCEEAEGSHRCRSSPMPAPCCAPWRTATAAH